MPHQKVKSVKPFKAWMEVNKDCLGWYGFKPPYFGTVYFSEGVAKEHREGNISTELEIIPILISPLPPKKAKKKS